MHLTDSKLDTTNHQMPHRAASLSALPFAPESIWQSPIRQLTFQDAQPFSMGAAGYWIYGSCFSVHESRLLLSTFEHELTHALFAWLTLHKVTGLGGRGAAVDYVPLVRWRQLADLYRSILVSYGRGALSLVRRTFGAAPC